MLTLKFVVKSISAALVSACTFVSLQAQVSLPAVFSNNMVLQREKPIAIWGLASAGEFVTVNFANQTKTAVANSVGKWQIMLDAMPANDKPSIVTITGKNTIQLTNVLVGDVWLCSGQSNMEYPLDRKLKKYALPKKSIDSSELELKATKPNAIRYLYVERTLNQPDLPTKGWADGNDTMVRYVSAIGYYFAKEIYATTKVPIGIISSSWGGTRVEQWTPNWAYKQSPIFKAQAKDANYKIDGMHPGQMFDKLIAPILPYGIKGMLWYQGESNCMVEDQTTYPAKMELLIDTWRNLFNDKQLPFYYVQLAPYNYTARKDAKPHTLQSLPLTWEAQTKNLAIPNTAMVVTTDLVDNLADIHPSYKWIVAHRLALCALAKNYQQKLEYSGPAFKATKIKKNKIELSFSHVGTGLISSDGKPLTWFTIAGADNQFVPATATIKGNKIIVEAAQVTKPTQVRFAWNETAQPNLFNVEGLPALPFRTVVN
ncbi:MAG: sialate O-acetylesterase [Flavobacterium sp.]|nr:sialate O-acetylesterase [Flavobacterium sp.]